MRSFWWTIAVLLVLVPMSTDAEIYKYRDENGVIRYTDNIVEVPKSQQRHVEAHPEIQALDSAEAAGGIETMEAVAQRLQQEKEMLRQEFETLESERLLLEEEAKIARPVAENEIFEKRIVDYNLRLQQYEEKRLRFEEKVDAYNAVIDSRFKKTK